MVSRLPYSISESPFLTWRMKSVMFAWELELNWLWTCLGPSAVVLVRSFRMRICP